MDKERIEEVDNDVFIGNQRSSQNIDLLYSNGITHILIVAAEIEPAFPEQFIYKQIHLEDDPMVDVASFFPEAHEFIEQAIGSNDKVLVHCAKGISRSATVVLSYLMKKHGLTYKVAMSKLREKYEFADPNFGFLMALQEYEEAISQSN